MGLCITNFGKITKVIFHLTQKFTHIIMKKKFFFFIALLMAASMTFISCDKKSKIKELAEKANSQCPMAINTGCTMVSITFDGTDLVYTAEVSEDIFQGITSEPAIVKKLSLHFFSNPKEDVRELIKELEKADAGIKFVYVGKDSRKEFPMHFTIDDIKSAMNNPTATMSPEERLSQYILIANHMFPMDVENGIVITNISMEQGNVVYNATTDEDIVKISDIRSMKNEIYSSMLSEMQTSTDSEIVQMLSLCKDAHANIVYRYVGQKSNESVDIVLPYTEL